MSDSDPARRDDFGFFAPPITTWIAPPEPEPEFTEPTEPEAPVEPQATEPEAPVEPAAAQPEVGATVVSATADTATDDTATDDTATDDLDDEDPPELRKVRPRKDPMPRPKLALLLTAGFVGLLIVVNVAVLAFHAVRARNQLDSARQTLQAARASISAGNIDSALRQVSGMHAKTQAAAASTSGSIWHFDEHLPLVGQSLRSVGTLARSVNDVAANALPGLTRSVTTLRGGQLRNPDGSLNLALVEQTAGSLTTTTSVLTQARTQVAALPAHPLIGAVGRARTQLLGQLDGLLVDLNGASEAAKLAPGMLGADGPRKYFLALMNPAESRGAGGLVGAYAIVVADKGKLSLETVGVDDDFPPFKTPVINVSPEFTARWRPFFADLDIRNATASPHFPWDAAAITQLWYRFKDEKVDGVIALDPAAAASLIQPGHPLVLSDGTTLTNADFATYVEQTLYAKFAGNDQSGRKLELEDIERLLFQNLQSGGNPEDTLRALGHAAGARELLLESNHPDEQTILAGTPLGGALPDTPGPFVGVAIHNAIANKMDAYLERTLRWSAGACPTNGGPRQFTTTLTLHNATPTTPLAPEVGDSNSIPGVLPSGSNRSWVSVYGAVGAIPTKATLDGQPVDPRLATERSHPVVGVYVDLAPGQSRTLTVTWSDPEVIGANGKPIAQTAQPPLLQPLVIPPNVVTSVADCPV